MIRFLEALRDRYTWKHVGTRKGETFVIDDNGDRIPGRVYILIYNLFERGDGKRKVTKHGSEVILSPHATRVKADVDAWLHGGDMPDVLIANPPSKPPRNGGKLSVIDGGKA